MFVNICHTEFTGHAYIFMFLYLSDYCQSKLAGNTYYMLQKLNRFSRFFIIVIPPSAGGLSALTSIFSCLYMIRLSFRLFQRELLNSEKRSE